jgi:hypothetical protein
MRGGGGERLFWEAFKNARVVKATAVLLIVALVVVGCGHEASLSRALEKLNYDSLPAKARRPTKPAEKLHAAVGELRGLFAVQGKRDLSDRQVGRAGAARAQVGAQLRALDHQFAADRKKLVKLGGAAALRRLNKIEKRTTTLAQSLQATFARIPRDGTHAGAPTAKASKLLAALSPDPQQQPLSSHLGFGMRNADRRPASLSAGITPAYNSPTATEAASDLPRTPEPADLAATAETKVTPAIHELAQQLGGDPVKIYRYVHNNIRYEPYYGIRKGADQTLAEKGGSDADQAALLIALLRDSGINARFVQGTAEMPAAKAANWVGVDTAGGERLDAVPDILASGGIPTTQVRANGQLVKIKFDHIWAEAYVPSDAYRGTEEGLAGKAWLPLDASIKTTEFHRPVADFRELLKPTVTDWATGLARDAQGPSQDSVVVPAGFQASASVDGLFDRAATVLRDHGLGDNSKLRDVIGSRDVHTTSDTYLPASTPFRAVTVSGERRGIPSSLTASVSIEVSGSDPLSVPNPDPDAGDAGISFQLPTTELANKRVTIGYAPATGTDAEIIDAYHGLLNAPTYAAALIPVLRVGGKVVARGHQAVSTGYTQNLAITYRMPGFSSDRVANPVYVGSLSALAVDLGFSTATQLEKRADGWKSIAPSIDSSNLLTDARAGEAMSMLGSTYFLRNDVYNAVTAQTMGVEQQRSLSGGLVATDVTPTYVASFPVFTRFSGMYMDVDEDAQSVVSRLDAPEAADSYMRASGLNASASEGRVFERAFGQPSASTAKVIQVATQQQVPVMQITPENQATTLPELNVTSQVRAEITQAVGGGATVVVPRDRVTIGQWTGSGYIVYGEGGSADYRITGGSSGGILDWLDLVWWAEKLGAQEWAVRLLACFKLFEEIGKVMLIPVLVDNAWMAIVLAAEAWFLAPGAVLTGGGLIIAIAILMIWVSILVIYNIYEAEEHIQVCGDAPLG